MEADLLRYYGLDLLELGTGRFTWRRLRVLVEALPPDSATYRSVGGARAQWGDTEHLLALVVDELAVSNWLVAKVNAKRPPPFPPPLPRPGAPREHRGRSTLTSQEMADRLTAFRERRRREMEETSGRH